MKTLNEIQVKIKSNLDFASKSTTSVKDGKKAIKENKFLKTVALLLEKNIMKII